MEKLRSVALIPARSGSKGIPQKNFKMFCGKPLVSWTTMAAIESGVFDKVIVSMDGGWDLVDWKAADPRMLKKYNGVLTIDNERPDTLASDTVTLDKVLEYYRNKKEYKNVEAWCVLQPTSPLRTATDIRKAYRKISAKKWDSVVSVIQDPMMGWVDDALKFNIKKKGVAICLYNYLFRPNRQKRLHWFRETGSIYFCKYYVIDTFHCRIGAEICLLELPKENSVEIDDEFDWKIAEYLMEERLNGSK